MKNEKGFHLCNSDLYDNILLFKFNNYGYVLNNI